MREDFCVCINALCILSMIILQQSTMYNNRVLSATVHSSEYINQLGRRVSCKHVDVSDHKVD